jgi:DNA-binding transcriptional LysR family regulator
VSVRELLVDRIVLVGRTDHPLAARRVGPADLHGQPIIAFEPGSAIRQIIDARLQRAGIEVDVAMELRSIPSILRMVATTHSLAFVSRLSLETESAVRAIPVRGLSISRTLGLAVRAGFPLSAPAEAFVQRLTAVAAATDGV